MPNSQIAQQWKQQKDKEAITTLEEVIERIKNGGLVITNFGWWENKGFGYAFRLDVQDSEDSSDSE